jgi:exodeoxyribonuclease VII large subunit
MRENPSAGKILTVFQLTTQIKHSLEAAFPAVWVSGEISNLSRPQSGHVYLTLKDDRAQMRATIWQSTAARLKFDLHDGLEVVCQGDIDVYPPRGSYQLIVRRVEPLGIGGLQLAFRRLHERLSAEGLFAPERKRRLPKFPRRIAFVTSPTGAAIRDFLEVVRRRWRGVQVLVVPARVQGPGAAAEIVAGIHLANRLQPPLDVLVVGRGGGSLEDLWCFNEEPVVRAVAASRTPTVSAVGHEIDVTLCDLAADVRALTPTEAAEHIVPSTDEVRNELARVGARYDQAIRSRVLAARQRFESLAERRVMRRPLDLIQDLARRLDELELRGARALRHRHLLASERLAAGAARLESLSPVAVLGRGYSITEKAATGEVVRSSSTLSPGELITTRFSQGAATSRVESIDE